MLLASLLVPIAVLAIVLLVQRLHLPAFLAIMATVVVYGIAADMQFQSVGDSFGLGFASAIEQVGLLVVAGALVSALALRQPLGTGSAAVAGAFAGMGVSASGALALLQPAGQDAPRRALGMALTLLSVAAFVAPAPHAAASANVLKVGLGTMALAGLPLALIAAAVGWWHVARQVPGSGAPGRLGWAWLAIAIPLAGLVGQSFAHMPGAPFGMWARDFFSGLSRPLLLAVVAITLGVLFAGRWQPSALIGRSWAPLLLTVGAAGGLSRVFDETGVAPLVAETVLHPRYGILTPFLAAAVVKTMQGGSLTAVLTATGMIEPMLPALGLDSPNGRVLAALSAGAGSIAICHVNDPFFWIAASIARLSPGRALVVVSLGSAAMALAALIVLAAVRQFI